MCSDSYGHPLFTSAISENHFRFLHCCISFDDYSTRTGHWEADHFAAIRKIFELINQNCRSTLYLCKTELVSSNSTQTNQPNMDFFSNLYTVQDILIIASAPYCEKPKSKPRDKHKQGTYEVRKHMIERLCKYISLKGWNISFDRLYTSIPLAGWLLAKYIISVGMLVANWKGLPKEFIKTTEREKLSLS